MCLQLELQPLVILGNKSIFQHCGNVYGPNPVKIILFPLLFVPNSLKISEESKSQYEVGFGGFSEDFLGIWDLKWQKTLLLGP